MQNEPARVSVAVACGFKRHLRALSKKYHHYDATSIQFPLLAVAFGQRSSCSARPKGLGGARQMLPAPFRSELTRALNVHRYCAG
jgi:hypothetical protein